MHVQQLMTHPARVCAPWSALSDAAEQMWTHDVGAIPVVDANYQLAGIITDRDVAMAVWLKGRAPSDVRVDEVMTGTVFTCGAEDEVSDALTKMRRHQVRRLPVLSPKGRVLGMLSLAEAAAAVGGRQGVTARMVIDAFRGVSKPRVIPEAA